MRSDPGPPPSPHPARRSELSAPFPIVYAPSLSVRKVLVSPTPDLEFAVNLVFFVFFSDFPSPPPDPKQPFRSAPPPFPARSSGHLSQRGLWRPKFVCCVLYTSFTRSLVTQHLFALLSTSMILAASSSKFCGTFFFVSTPALGPPSGKHLSIPSCRCESPCARGGASQFAADGAPPILLDALSLCVFV